jgi:hypothetical protein
VYLGRHFDTRGSLFTFVNAETVGEDKALYDEQREQSPNQILDKSIVLVCTVFEIVTGILGDCIAVTVVNFGETPMRQRWWCVPRRVSGTRVHCSIVVYLFAATTSLHHSRSPDLCMYHTCSAADNQWLFAHSRYQSRQPALATLAEVLTFIPQRICLTAPSTLR